MSQRTRRAFVTLTGAVAAGLAGCTDGWSRPGTAATTPTDSPAGSQSTTASDSPSPTQTASGHGLRLDVVTEFGAGDVATVYPRSLRAWLRQAASTTAPVRAHADVGVDNREPVLTGIDAVRLRIPGGNLGGTYAMDCEGGVRYRLLVGAEAVDPPADATPTPVAELPAARRELARAAIAGEGPRVYPETELGSWVRTAFFGGYFEEDGIVYRGHEVRQTDAAFFSEAVWYVLSLSPDGAANDPVELRFPPLDPAVRSVIDDLLADRTYDTKRLETSEAVQPPVERFADRTDHLLVHDVVFAVELVGAGR